MHPVGLQTSVPGDSRHRRTEEEEDEELLREAEKGADIYVFRESPPCMLLSRAHAPRAMCSPG
jgi:hypothetical protein